MTTIKTNELTGASLDWAVAKCEGWKPHAAASVVITGDYSPSTNWTQGGPIIERERIRVTPMPPGRESEGWVAGIYDKVESYGMQGQTALIVAMRCYVASKLGDSVEVPDQLTNEVKS